ncbi:uncharacterized protein LOC128551642, partial [Mercenaria mercenaria]|uniref:uncharacterized protein LOC128551642 n=1 Tax=Mercenaria mercenaria TaxID=6596 RepID=UPI00234F99B4
NGRIEFQEFYSFMQAEMSKISDGDFANKEEVIRSAFRTFDKDGNGFIDANEFRMAMKKLGERLTDNELEDMMKQTAVAGDGKVNYEGAKELRSNIHGIHPKAHVDTYRDTDNRYVENIHRRVWILVLIRTQITNTWTTS